MFTGKSIALSPVGLLLKNILQLMVSEKNPKSRHSKCKPAQLFYRSKTPKKKCVQRKKVQENFVTTNARSNWAILFQQNRFQRKKKCSVSFATSRLLHCVELPAVNTPLAAKLLRVNDFWNVLCFLNLVFSHTLLSINSCRLVMLLASSATSDSIPTKLCHRTGSDHVITTWDVRNSGD